MKILIAGATGYIGKQLIPQLEGAGHTIVALVRKSSSFDSNIKEIVCDLVKESPQLPEDIDAAYYLVHNMDGQKKFEEFEIRAATHFVDALKNTSSKQIIYLSGIANDIRLSRHIRSRLYVEKILKASGIPTTILRSAIVIGQHSTPFVIANDLVRRLPVMITPKWTQNLCQPIAIDDLLYYLINVLNHEDCLKQTFDIGGPDVLSYHNIMHGIASVRGVRRLILPIPLLTPKLSSYWLYLITSVNFALASTLIDNLTTNFVCKDQRINDIIPLKCKSFLEAVKDAIYFEPTVSHEPVLSMS